MDNRDVAAAVARRAARRAATLEKIEQYETWLAAAQDADRAAGRKPRTTARRQRSGLAAWRETASDVELIEHEWGVWLVSVREAAAREDDPAILAALARAGICGVREIPGENGEQRVEWIGARELIREPAADFMTRLRLALEQHAGDLDDDGIIPEPKLSASPWSDLAREARLLEQYHRLSPGQLAEIGSVGLGLDVRARTWTSFVAAIKTWAIRADALSEHNNQEVRISVTSRYPETEGGFPVGEWYALLCRRTASWDKELGRRTLLDETAWPASVWGPRGPFQAQVRRDWLEIFPMVAVRHDLLPPRGRRPRTATVGTPTGDVSMVDEPAEATPGAGPSAGVTPVGESTGVAATARVSASDRLINFVESGAAHRITFEPRHGAGEGLLLQTTASAVTLLLVSRSPVSDDLAAVLGADDWRRGPAQPQQFSMSLARQVRGLDVVLTAEAGLHRFGWSLDYMTVTDLGPVAAPAATPATTSETMSEAVVPAPRPRPLIPALDLDALLD